MAVDSAGNLYVADSGNSTIRKVTPSRTVTTIAGLAGGTGSADGIGSAARFHNPYGVAVGSDGKVYVADELNDTIRQIARGGLVTTLAGQVGVTGWGNGVGTGAQFYYPRGVAVDSVTNVYVADTYNSTIRKIAPGAVVTTVAGLARSSGNVDGVGSNARFNAPTGIAVDTWGNVYVADSSAHTIRKMTPGGVVSTLAGRVNYVGSADGVGTNATFNQPKGVAVDSATNIYVADYNNHTIRKVAPAGTNWVVSTFAGMAGNSGSSDGVGSNARFSYPSGVAVDSAGNLYVADTVNHTIRKITPARVVSTVAGLAMDSGAANGAGDNARFNFPNAIAVDSLGNLYVADGNTTIRLGFPPPSLSLSGSANLLILSWPVTASNYVLEASSALSSDSTWVPLTNSLGTVGDSFVVTNIPTADAEFYRLRLP
jgi:sugar lactone lactonase YvrE